MEDKEKLLDILEKKLDCRKKAIDDEWSRLDKIKADLKSQQIRVD